MVSSEANNPPSILPPEALAEFKEIYLAEFDQVLSEDEAREMAMRLLRLFDVLLRPSSDEATP